MASKIIKGLIIEIGGDTSKLGDALKDVEKHSQQVSAELGDINRLLKMDPGNTDLLAQKQKVLADAIETSAKKLDTLKQAEKQVQAQFKQGKVSEEQVRALQREIVATEKKMDGYQQAAEETERSIKGLGQETKKTDKSSSNLGSTLASAAKTGFMAVTAAATAAVTGLVAAAESTREYRTEMGKLDAAFTSSGHSSKSASAAYSELYSIIGETDQSVEAAQQIALLADSEKDVAEWAGLASGVVGKFGDALQPETFFEAANETMKLGESTGAYTQMLEGCGMSVEKFNEGLAACSTDAERQAYMLSVTQQALGEAGKAYEQNNAEIIRSNQATDEWMQSLSGVGGAVEPLITDVKLLGASLLADTVPGVQELVGAFRDVITGVEGGSERMGAAMSNLVTGLLEKLTSALPTIFQVGGSLISTLVTSIFQQLPTLLTTGGQIIGQLLTGIANALPNLLQSAVNVLSNFTSGLQTALPKVLEQGRQILTNLVQGIASNLPSLVSQALDAIMQFATTIYDAAPSLIDTGFDLLSRLVQGILNCLPTLISKVPEIISKFANTINDNFPTILKKGAELILQIIKGIISAIPTLIKNIPKIITAIVDVWEAFNWLQLGKKALKLLGDGIKAMWGWIKSAGKGALDAVVNILKNLPQNLLNLGKNAAKGLGNAIRSGWSMIKSAASSLFQNIVNYFKTLPSKLLQVGKDLVKGLWNGISNMTGWVISKIKGFGESILGGIKDFFGIKSPSREFAEIGKYLDQGLAKGLLDNMKTPIGAMQDVAGSIMGEAQDMDGLTLERSLRVQSAQQATIAAAANSATLAGKLDRILAAIEKGQILMLDSDKVVGGTAAKYDTVLGQRRTLAARGAI